MKNKFLNFDPIELLLNMAQHQRQKSLLPPDWRGRVMEAVSDMAAQGAAPVRSEENTREFTGLAFRFARAAVLLAAGLCFYALVYGPDLEAHAVKFVMDYPMMSLLFNPMQGG